ncbi:MAG: hypothetical protein Q8Q81_10005 [Oxalobacteraceae bacterium]|nr:hypothetical protein [Oxalobacteraceae bacterium]
MIEKKNTLLSMAVALALTACGGGGGSTPATLATSTGKAVDGYLSGSSVLCDTNNNGVADAGEATVTTNSLGDFVFSPACSSTIVVSGGTNIDTGLAFKGRLKAPAGSTVATPLTSLMVDGGLTAAQVAAALGLPAGTDVSKVDPMSNPDLQKKTLAMQQIIQQVADTVGSLAQNTSPAAIQAIYSVVAKAVVTTLAANPTEKLVDASGSVSTTLVFGIVKQSVKKVQETTDATLATTKAGVSTFSPTSVAEMVSGAIGIQAQTLAKASDVALIGLTKSLQSNPTIANAASELKNLLTTVIENSVNLTALGTALTQLSDTDTSNDAAVTTAVSSEVTAQATAAGVTESVIIDVGAWSQHTNYLAIQNDSIELNGTPYTLKEFLSGVPLAQNPAAINTVSFAFDVKGTPIPKNDSGVMTTKVKLGLELTDTGASGRVLQFMLDQADVTLDNNKQLNVSVPAGAKLYAYGKTSNGTNANMTLTDITADQFVATANNKLTVNAGNMLARILAKVQAQPASPIQSVFSNLQNVSGTFNVKVVVSNLNISSQTDSTAVKGLSVSVTGSGQPAVNGLGVEGIVTVQ